MHKCLTGSEKDSSRRTMPPREMNASITPTRPTICHSLKKDCFSNSLLFLLNAVYSGQWKLSFGTPPFRGHKILSRKNVHIIYVSNASIGGTPLFTGKGHYFNLRLAARAKMSLSQAQNIFMPAHTINT